MEDTQREGRSNALELIDEELNRNASDPKIWSRIGNLEEIPLKIWDEDDRREVERRQGPNDDAIRVWWEGEMDTVVDETRKTLSISFPRWIFSGTRSVPVKKCRVGTRCEIEFIGFYRLMQRGAEKHSLSGPRNALKRLSSGRTEQVIEQSWPKPSILMRYVPVLVGIAVEGYLAMGRAEVEHNTVVLGPELRTPFVDCHSADRDCGHGRRGAQVGISAFRRWPAELLPARTRDPACALSATICGRRTPAVWQARFWR